MMSTDTAAAVSVRRARWGTSLRLALAAGLLVLLAQRFGSGPFAAALSNVRPGTIVAAVMITLYTTACNTYRWRTVSIALGTQMTFGHGYAAYFRSQLINAVLPGGIVGDVDRGVRERRRSAATGGRQRTNREGGRALRAVAWERVLGQLLQVFVTALVVVAIPSTLRDALPRTARGVLVVATAVAVVVTVLAVRGAERPSPRLRGVRTMVEDWRRLRNTPHALAAVAIASAASMAGYLALFALAADRIGLSVSVGALIPMALVVLVLGAIPANLAGFGPREGAAAWVFALAGVGAAQGISVSVLFGVLALIGVLPGLAVLLFRRGEVRRG